MYQHQILQHSVCGSHVGYPELLLFHLCLHRWFSISIYLISIITAITIKVLAHGLYKLITLCGTLIIFFPTFMMGKKIMQVQKQIIVTAHFQKEDTPQFCTLWKELIVNFGLCSEECPITSQNWIISFYENVQLK